jgi:hypothetical protein
VCHRTLSKRQEITETAILLPENIEKRGYGKINSSLKRLKKYLAESP